MQTADVPAVETSRTSFAEAARIVALQLSKRSGNALPVLGSFLSGKQDPSLIVPRLYLGDFFHASNEEIIARLRITHIVSVIETPPIFKSGTTLKTMHVSLRDSSVVDILRHLDQTTEFLCEALQDPDTIVLVHCFQGISRSTTVVAAYLLATSAEFSSAKEVLAFLRTKRSVVSPNFGFIRQLDEYAVRCIEKRRMSTSNHNPNDDVDGLAKAKMVPNEGDAIGKDDTVECNTVS